jgi:hypothetical protein
MPPDSEADLAHPETADWVLGTMGPAQAEDFQRHLTGCLHCQAAVAEFGELGQMLQHLPPAAEPPPELETRTIASVLAAAAQYPAPKADPRSDPEDQAATRVQPRPQPQPPAGDETRVQPRPQLQPPAKPQARPEVTRLPAWRHYRGRLAAVVAAAAAIIIAALVVIPNLGGATVAVSLSATPAAKLIGDGAATGRATAHQAGPSWTFQMTVHGLKVLPGPNDVYECWWVGPGSSNAHPQFVSGGTFVVDKSGSTTVTMTTGIDPTQFRTMEITAESPGTGARQGAVLLIGRT